MLKIIGIAMVCVLCMAIGYIIGTNAVMRVLPFVGTLNVAHDSDGEKYTSLVIDRRQSDFMDNRSVKYVIFIVKHLYSEEKKK